MYHFIQTPLGEMLLRRADSSEEAEVLALMRSAATWLLEKCIPQWQGALTDKGVQVVHLRVEAGLAYLGSLNGQNMETVSIQWEDSFSWGEKGLDGSAGYIHGLAVSRELAGKGIGRSLLGWSMDFIKVRKPYVRLDCMAENPRLCRYYEEAGFSKVGQTGLPNGFKVNLYENH